MRLSYVQRVIIGRGLEGAARIVCRPIQVMIAQPNITREITIHGDKRPDESGELIGPSPSCRNRYGLTHILAGQQLLLAAIRIARQRQRASPNSRFDLRFFCVSYVWIERRRIGAFGPVMANLRRWIVLPIPSNRAFHQDGNAGPWR